MLATTTHPDLGSTILCGLFGVIVLRTILRAMFGKYDQDRAVPREVRKGRPR